MVFIWYKYYKFYPSNKFYLILIKKKIIRLMLRVILIIIMILNYFIIYNKIFFSYFLYFI